MSFDSDTEVIQSEAGNYDCHLREAQWVVAGPVSRQSRIRNSEILSVETFDGDRRTPRSVS